MVAKSASDVPRGAAVASIRQIVRLASLRVLPCRSLLTRTLLVLILGTASVPQWRADSDPRQPHGTIASGNTVAAADRDAAGPSVTTNDPPGTAAGPNDSRPPAPRRYEQLREEWERTLGPADARDWRLRPRDPSRLYLYAPPELTLDDVPASGVPANSVPVDNTSADTPATPDNPSSTDPQPPDAAPTPVGSASFTDQLAELVRESLRKSDAAVATTPANRSPLADAHAWVHELLCLAPRHEDARRWLGLPARSAAPPVLRRNGDATRSTAGLELRKPRRPHPRFAWPAGQYLLVNTPHFRIATNDTEASARELARSLERLHCVWHQLFFATWHEETPWSATRGERAAPRRNQASHQVVLFRSHDDYVSFLRTIEPKAAATRGYYHAATRTAYFVGGERPATATWYHEATHQLFHERQPAARDVGHSANFWLLEGVALYMESLQHVGPRVCLGGLEADRLQTARYRALREGFFVPLESFTALNQNAWQSHPRLHAIYSQAAGLTHFLMHAEGGRYRPVVESLLRRIYAGEDEPDALFRLTGASPAELEASYRRFLTLTDDDIAQRDPTVPIRQLCLGGTQVSGGVLDRLGPLEQCEWLDLFGLAVDDTETRPLENTPRLRQLSLENTGAGDATVERLAASRALQELDLSGSRISDRSLETLARLEPLQTLWLTNTGVTDRGVALLERLPQLQTLDLEGTQTSAATREAWARRLSAQPPAPQDGDSRDVTRANEVPQR